MEQIKIDSVYSFRNQLQNQMRMQGYEDQERYNDNFGYIFNGVDVKYRLRFDLFQDQEGQVSRSDYIRLL